MAYQGICWGLDKNNDTTTRRFGLIMALLVTGKSLIETITGQVMFGQFHIGDVGSPIPACHAGGALAGLVMGTVFSLWKRFAVD